MKPTWQSECGTVRLYLGDCLDVLPHLEGVDAVVTDPPYGVGFGYASHDDDPARYSVLVGQWFAAMRRTCNGPIIATTGIRNLSVWLAQEQSRWILCWWKAASSSRCTVGFTNWEPMPLWGKPRGAKKCDVIRTPCFPREDIGHPCPKPIEWGEGVLEIVSRQSDIVLDPFMGSGTTGVACARLGRRFIGIEIEPRYFEIAKRRIQEALHSQPLFAGQA